MQQAAKMQAEKIPASQGADSELQGWHSLM